MTVICAAVYAVAFVGAMLTFIHACGNTSWRLGDRCAGAACSGVAVILMGAGIMDLCSHLA